MLQRELSFHQHDWERIQRLGVHAGVASPDRYATKVATGMALAHATLQATKEVVPTIPTIKGVHYIMFESVHPWAGTFRKPGLPGYLGALATLVQGYFVPLYNYLNSLW